MDDSFLTVLFAVIIGTLGAIVISLRYILLIERRMARMELHLEKLVMKIAKEEGIILAEEKKIERQLSRRKPAKKKVAKKKTTKRK